MVSVRFFYIVTALLKHNWHTIKGMYLKCRVGQYWIYVLYVCLYCGDWTSLHRFGENWHLNNILNVLIQKPDGIQYTDLVSLFSDLFLMQL